MTDQEYITAWKRGIVERARRYKQHAAGTDVLFWSELSGIDGAHYFLIREPRHTDADIAAAMESCRWSFDVTGFTVIEAEENTP